MTRTVKAVDIAVFMWIMQAMLFVIGSMYPAFLSAIKPEPLITASDINSILVYDASTSDPVGVAQKIIMVIIVPLLTSLLVSKFLSLSIGQTVLVAIGIGIGLFFFGKALFYIVSVGSLSKVFIEQMTGGLATLDTNTEWLLNSIGYIISFIALIDWWRGTSMRQMG